MRHSKPSETPAHYRWGLATRRAPSIHRNWGETSYSFSKLGVSALTRVLQKQADSNLVQAKGILINAGEPGNVRSKLNNYTGKEEPEVGADTATWLATLPHDVDSNPRGELCAMRKIMKWYDGYFGYPSCNYLQCAHKKCGMKCPVSQDL